ncbi:N-acetyl-gamma-glutamyl-phosphate reductase [uncultured Dysosmobacter sp.]|uniref:N-acetyl-gamma-glutamyl-phosphate reductase n=1 Tax=uncultured Dysosmobacter sp. TaxID=2591384 RepID=UPI002602588B|nr:N-acetyl-gamma-glutamyl-phosphate reductase [uncultured Dysosmobacter sp.]
MRPKVYIDGKDGTTGLQIYDRLAARSDIDLLLIDEVKRKDPAERKKLMDAADVVFLCLPDAAAIEAVSLVENPNTRIIDASTAHRTDPAWDYGFPELSPAHREAIKKSKRVANPGCHATGFISIVYPLTAMGLLPKDAVLSCFSLTGYSGGGKKMIAQYEGEGKSEVMASPAIYGVTQAHKHLPEMQKICGLAQKPVFSPIVDDYYKGMAATVPLHMSQIQGVTALHDVWARLYDYYRGQKLVRVAGDPTDEEGGIEASSKLYGAAKAGTDSLSLFVAGNDRQFTITALFDNLGKGASGAAVQNMNLMLGFPETTGLNL